MQSSPQTSLHRSPLVFSQDAYVRAGNILTSHFSYDAHALSLECVRHARR